MPRIRFSNLLLVPEGPPESVWERALDAVYAAAGQDTGPEDASPGPAVPGTENADLLAAGGDDSNSDPTTHDDGSAAPAWNAGQGPDGGNGPERGDDAGDGLPGDGDDLGY